MRVYVPPRRLILSGGGVRVVSYLGVLQVLKKQDLLKFIKEFCGVSAGALVSLLLALDYRFDTLERFCMEYNFANIRSDEPETALEFLENYGIDDGSNLKKLIEKILHHKGFGPTTTFKDLAASGRVKSLRVWAADIQHIKPVEFSFTKTPNASVVFALRASMCIPVYFMPLKNPETDTYLVDGGVMDNYPIQYLTEAEAQESLGITFEYSRRPIPIHDLLSYIGLLSSGYYMPSYQELVKKHASRTIVIPCAEQSPVDFELSTEKRQQLVAYGRQAAVDFFKGYALNLIRRHSVS
jgi:predicted acylesterase/phospholipase RssA